MIKKTFLLLNIICLAILVNHQYYLFKWNEIEQDNDILATSRLQNLETHFRNDEKFLFSYFQKLNLIDFNFQEADIVIDRLLRTKASKDYFIMSGDLKLILGDTACAISKYETAINIIPLIQVPKYKIMKIYLDKKDTSNAIFWMHKILNTKVKVNSPVTDSIQSEVKLLFNKYKTI